MKKIIVFNITHAGGGVPGDANKIVRHSHGMPANCLSGQCGRGQSIGPELPDYWGKMLWWRQ